MDKIKKWQIFFGSNRHPICITDKDTNICYYCNDEFFRIYNVTDTIIGKRLVDFLPQEEYHLEQALPNWEQEELFETETYNKRLNQRFFTRTVYDKQENIFICETIPTDNDLTQNFEFEEAMTRCMEIYAQPENTVLLSFMELLCDFYDCERAYVYRFNFQSNTINCVSQWCSDPAFHVTKEIGTKMDSTFLMNWLETEHIAGIVSADSDSPDFNHHSTLAQIFETFKMKNLTLCTVEDSNRKVVGLVGISNRRDYDKFFDRRLITTIARFVSQDVTQKSIDSTFFQVQNRDTLTGLYNRTAYDKKVAEIKTTPPKKLGVISVNINGLKNINNSLGNEHGDKHILESAQTVKAHFGYDIFRVSGDELVGLAYDIDREEFDSKVSQLLTKMRQEHIYDFSVGSSWGVGHIDFVTLLREADNAMYINKQEYYSVGLRSFDSVSNTILSDLLSFLDAGEFMIYLQPQVRLSDSSLHGAEALIRRYDKKNNKMVFPDQFISLYEQSSVIRHVDLFVVETVCQLLEKWSKTGNVIPISVNLSRVTLQEFGIVNRIVDICDKYRVPHRLVVIEVTERVGLIENDVPSSLVTEFINHDFTISLDDFGCAYSNIVTLALLQVDEVKLDKSLVDNLTTNRKNHILVKNVLSMCEELEGTSTLAEGIEDVTQSTLLHELGCHLGQGYLYSRPIPVDEFERKYMS